MTANASDAANDANQPLCHQQPSSTMMITPLLYTAVSLSVHLIEMASTVSQNERMTQLTQSTNNALKHPAP